MVLIETILRRRIVTGGSQFSIYHQNMGYQDISLHVLEDCNALNLEEDKAISWNA